MFLNALKVYSYNFLWFCMHNQKHKKTYTYAFYFQLSLNYIRSKGFTTRKKLNWDAYNFSSMLLVILPNFC